MNPRQLERVVRDHFDVVDSRSTAEDLTLICPEPGCGDQSGNRSVNLAKGLTNCWRCGSRHGSAGSVIPWLRRHGIVVEEGTTINSNPSALESALNEVDIARHGRLNKGSHVKDIDLPAGFTPIADDPNSVYTELIESMAKRKRLELEDMVHAGVGFTRHGPWEPYAIFPVKEWGKVAYYQGRKYAEKPGDVTKKFPNKKDVPLGSRHWVYNIDEVRKRNATTVIVVEAILSVLSLERELGWSGPIVPVAVFKHKISAEQLAKMIAVRTVKELNIMFDVDATQEVWTSCSQLTNRFKVTVTELSGTKKQDPNDDPRYALDQFARRKSGSPVNALLSELK